MQKFKKFAATFALVGAGMLATAGFAHAGPSDDDEQYQNGLVNVQDINPVLAAQACNNNVPVNVLGVQVPVQDNTAGVLGGASSTDACGQAAIGAEE